MKVALGTLKEEFSTSTQQDVSEFFYLFWSQIYLLSSTLKEKNELLVYEIATCEDCGTENRNVISENLLHLQYSKKNESGALFDIPKLIGESFCNDNRSSRCYSDNCNGKDTAHSIKKTLLNVPDIFAVQINRFCRQGSKNKKNSSPIKLDSSLDLKFALE